LPSQEPLASPPKPPPAIEGEPSPGRPRRKPAAEAAAPPPDPAAAPAFDAGALLAGDLVTLPARFDDLVGERINEHRRAVIDARAVASETSAEAERAALDVPPAERALLRDRTDDAHATLVAARARSARARETAELAQRELDACEQALAAARREAGLQIVKAALPLLSKDRFMAEAFGPHIDRLWSILMMVRAEVVAIDAKLQGRSSMLTAFYKLASLAAADLNEVAAMPEARGFLPVRYVDVHDVKDAAVQALSERAKKGHLPGELNTWLSYWVSW